LGTKRHVLFDQNGIPLAVVLTGANVHDSKAHNETWSSIILVRPDSTEVLQHACEDKAYDSEELRRWLAKRGYAVHIPHRGLDTAIKAGDKRYPARRWVSERTGRWHNLFRRLKTRYEKRWENYLAFICFANAIICFLSC
jgi:putative transposase